MNTISHNSYTTGECVGHSKKIYGYRLWTSNDVADRSLWYDGAVAYDKIQNVVVVGIGYMGKEHCLKCTFAWSWMGVIDEFLSPKFSSFFLYSGIFDFIDHNMRILCPGHEIKVKKVWRNKFWKKRKNYKNFWKNGKILPRFYRNFIYF